MVGGWKSSRFDASFFYLGTDLFSQLENEVLAAFLARWWAVPIATTRMIAAGAGGNVRAAMGDLEMWLG
jgi:hypothetical protein